MAKGIKAYNPILAGQLTREEINTCSKDHKKPLKLSKSNEEVVVSKERKKVRYTPLSKRKDRPDSVLWLVIMSTEESTTSQFIQDLYSLTFNLLSLI